jgi:chemotaxis protein methyltransferase CheR
MLKNTEDIDIKEYLKILKENSPYDFCDYSDNSIARRVQKVMRDYRLSYEELVKMTRNDPAFCEQIVDSLAVNTTELFRDPLMWQFLLEKIYPSLKNKTNLNIWHAGCSSGQEVYSNIIMLDHLNMLDNVTIYASDISKKILDQAIKGIYKYEFNKGYLENFNQVFQDRTIDFHKYLDIDEVNDKFIIKDFMKERVRFCKYDLVQDNIPFYNKFDIIFCRNVLIYFNVALQSKIINRFYQMMFPGAILCMGIHETITGFYKTKFLKNGFVYNKNNGFHLK